MLGYNRIVAIANPEALVLTQIGFFKLKWISTGAFIKARLS
jgi:Na+/H+ antiporter NhaB